MKIGDAQQVERLENLIESVAEDEWVDDYNKEARTEDKTYEQLEQKITDQFSE